MLTCIARSKQQPSSDDHPPPQVSSSHPPLKPHLTKSLSSQFKEIALKASGAYRHCNSCTGHLKHKESCTIDPSYSVSASASDRFKWSYRHHRSLRLKSKGEMGGGSSSRATVFVEESEPKEWVAQVEPGVLITFVSLVGGGNHLNRIRFSKEMFDKTRAQRWWTDNFDRVMELYNVQRLDRQAFPLPTPPRSEDENAKIEAGQQTPGTPPLNRESVPRALYRPMGMGTGYSSSDSVEQHSVQSHHFRDSGGLTSTPKQSSISAAKTDTSTVDASKTTSSSREDSLSVSNASDLESEWVEEDEPGVYITIKALPNGTRELKRVRFR
uniref:BRX domain-containing protein n=1 Tax=Kalanchoe fedtschenkoi TaxID=63787 RepID=A0A7N0TMD1_KALFE